MKTSISSFLVSAVLAGCASNIQTKTLYSPGNSQPNDPRIALLDRLKKENKYEELMFTIFPDARNRGTVPFMNAEESEQDFFWLRGKAELPPPTDADFPLYYFFSWKLAFPHKEHSRRVNARGKVGLMLMSSLCIKDTPYSAPLVALVEGGTFNNMRLREGREWLVAIDNALDWHAKWVPVFGDREWFCGPGNTLPRSEVAERYSATLKKIRQANSEKLKQY